MGRYDMKAEYALLVSVLSDGFRLVIDVLQNGSDGGQIDGKSYNEYFTFQRMPDGRIDYAFMWKTYGHAGYFSEESLLRMYGGEPMKVARNIVFDCLRGEQTASEEDFSEIIAELEKRLAPRTMNAEDFMLLPSE